MATKKEMVAELVSLGVNEDEIKDLKNPELEAMLDKMKETVVQDEEKQEEEVIAPEKVEVKAKEGKVVRETIQQLGIFTDYIYNVMYKDAEFEVENLGYGDIYVSTEGLAKVGLEKQRILFGERLTFSGVERLYFISASQPVVQILEVK